MSTPRAPDPRHIHPGAGGLTDDGGLTITWRSWASSAQALHNGWRREQGARVLDVLPRQSGTSGNALRAGRRQPAAPSAYLCAAFGPDAHAIALGSRWRRCCPRGRGSRGAPLPLPLSGPKGAKGGGQTGVTPTNPQTNTCTPAGKRTGLWVRGVATAEGIAPSPPPDPPTRKARLADPHIQPTQLRTSRGRRAKRYVWGLRDAVVQCSHRLPRVQWKYVDRPVPKNECFRRLWR